MQVRAYKIDEILKLLSNDTYLIPDDSWTTFNRTSHFGKMHSEVCD